MKEKHLQDEQINEVMTAEPQKVGSRKWRFRTMAIGLTVLVVVLVFAFNVVVSLLADRFPFSLDLTKDKLYSMSDESIKIAEAVDKDIEIIIFYDEETFESPNVGDDNLNTILRQFYSLLTEYSRRTDGKVSYEFVDAISNPLIVKEYKEDVSVGSILFRAGDRSKVITINDLYEVDTSMYYYTGEYTYSSLVEKQLATGLVTVMSNTDLVITMLTGHGEQEAVIRDLTSLYTTNGYTVEQVDFTTGQKINEKSKVLVLAAPSTDFSEAEISRLRTWLSNDGKRDRHIYLLCDYLAKCPQLYGMLSTDYGITVTENLISETSPSNMLFANASGGFFPLVNTDDSELLPNCSDKRVLMPATLQILLSKGSDSSKENPINVPVISFGDTVELVTNQVLAESEEGEEAEKPTYEPFKPESYPVYGMVYASDMTYVNNEAKYNNIVVSGSFLCAYSSSYAGYSSLHNEEMLMDVMNQLCGNKATVTVSAKEMSTEMLEFTSKQATIWGVWVFTIGIPVVVLAICLIVFLRRKHL